MFNIITDEERLAALYDLNLLDTTPEPAFDRLTRLASRILNAPISLVSLVDKDRQFFKSQCGLPEPTATLRQTPLSHSFCQHAVATGEPLIIEDARQHPLVKDNLAIPDLNVIAYAGIPLITSDGHALGSFCVIDTEPRHWTAEEILILKDLAVSVMTEIELRQELQVRKRLEEILRNQETFINNIIHSVPAFIYIHDQEKRETIYSNKTLGEFLGYPPDENITLRDVLSEADYEKFRGEFAALFLPDAPAYFDTEYNAQAGGGRRVWTHNRIMRFGTEGKQILGIVEDITVRKQAERASLQLLLEKEQMRLLQDFIQNTSHDLKTPLSLIQTSVDLMKRKQVYDPERLDRIETQVFKMADILDTFSTLMELEQMPHITHRPVQVDSLLQSTIRLLQTSKPIQLTVDDWMPAVSGDFMLLQQAFYAILENALHHAGQNGAIEVRAVAKDDHVTIEFQNDGAGIPQQDLQNIFKPLFKINRARTQSDTSRGGMGLAIVKRIITLHNGSIEAHLSSNQQTVFSVNLPLA